MDKLFLKNFTLFFLSLALLSAILVWILNYCGILEPMEAKIQDLRFKTRNQLASSLPSFFAHPRVKEQSSNVILVQISDECLKVNGKWPWKRDRFAELIDILRDSGALAIGFDISFFDSDLNHPLSDQAFKTALSKSKNIVLGSELIRRSLLTSQNGVIELPSIEQATLGEQNIEEIKAIPEFQSEAKSSGFVNIELSGSDGVIRAVPLTKKGQGEPYRSLGLALFETFQSENLRVLNEKQILIDTYEIPLWDRHQRLSLLEKFLHPAVGQPLFDHLAWINYLDYSSASPFPTELVSDILQKKTDPSIFRGKIVLIGFNAEGGILDKKLTPFEIMPGMEIQATVVENLIQKTFLHRNSNLETLLFLIVLTLILFAINLRTSFLSTLSANLILGLALAGLSMVCFGKFLYLFDLTPLLLQIFLIFGLGRLMLVSLSLRKKMLHLETLNRLANHLFTILVQENLSKAIFEVFQEYTRCTRCLILISDPVTEQVEYWSFGNVEDDFMVAVAKTEFRETLFKYWQTKQEILTLEKLNRQVGLELPKSDEHIHLFPLILKGQPFGSVIVSGNQPVGEIDQNFWLTLCQIIVASLENARLYRLATVDGLTGLFVRSFLDVQIKKEFVRAVRYGAKVGFLMSDIDHFKGFNDTYGHQIGDRVLRIVADEVKKSVREVDIAARYGGEELCVILPNTDKEGSMVIAERIRKNVESIRVPHEGKELRITISIGVSSIPENNPADVEAFMKEADYALYMAKQNGRNQVRFFTTRKAGE